MFTNVQNMAVLTMSVATASDGPELTELLQNSYRSSPDFTVRNESYFQDHFSGRSAVLILRSEEILIGTMRANLISSSADLAHEDEGMLTNGMLPALYLSRAATLTGSRTRGVNSMMRLYCIDAALELGLRSVVGFVYQDASRTRLMADLGYSFIRLRSDGNCVRTYHSQCLFAKMLLSESGESALALLRAQSLSSGSTMKWHGTSIADTLLLTKNEKT